MSKGSRPRPFSVSQKEFGNNFDAIFRKHKHQPTEEDIGAHDNEGLITRYDKIKDDNKGCYCYNCNKDRKTEQGWPWVSTLMILCPQCGNKRCPHSTDHNLACTNSNEPGQKGSVYE